MSGAFDPLAALEALADAAVEGYEQLARHAEAVDLGGLIVQVCTLDDLIAMKRAAGRPKDLIEVEVLAALQTERSGDGHHDPRF